MVVQSTANDRSHRFSDSPNPSAIGSGFVSSFTALMILLIFPSYSAAQSSANFPTVCAPLGSVTCSSFQGSAWRYVPRVCDGGSFATEEEAANQLYDVFYRPTNCSTNVSPNGPWLAGGPYSIPGCGISSNYASLPVSNPNTGIELLNYRPYLVSYVASLPTCQSSYTETHHVGKQRDQSCPPGMRSDVYGTNYVNGTVYSALYCRGNNELKDLGDSCPHHTAIGNPVNAATGNKFQRERDYLASGANPLSFERFYNNGGKRYSQRSQFGADWFSQIGQHWRHTYDRSIDLVESATLTTAFVYRPDGRVYPFNLYNDQYFTDADIKDWLAPIRDAAGVLSGWQYTNATDHSVETYDANGILISISDRNGLTQTLLYSDSSTPENVAPRAGLLIRVSDAFGHALNFTYTAQGRIATMTDPAGGVYRYDYDPNNYLTAVTYPDGTIRTYKYNESTYTSGANLPGVLTGIIDENGDRFATFTYDTQGRAISTEHSGGTDKAVLTYNADGTTDVTDALGATRKYTFNTILGVAKTAGISQPCSACGDGAKKFTYDANGNLASQTDFNGVQTTYTYDLSRNLETSRTEAVGTPEERTITTEWHSSFRLPTQITEPGRTTTFTYDAHGNRLTKTITAGGQSRTWSYTYNSFGQVTSVDGPRTDVSDVATLTYDTSGNLTSITNALGHVTTYGNYDAHGRVGRITDPNGVITDLTYDVRGRLISRTVDGQTTTFQYDGVGQLTKVTPPNGAYLQYIYNAAHRLTDITDALGNKIHTTYDLAGNRTKEEVFDPSNTLVRTHQWVYDTLSRLSQSIGAAGQTTRYEYDANGNRTSITDPLNRVTTYAYDALNRVVAETDPLTGSTGYSYDALDHLLAVTDPANLTTSYSYNGFGDRLQETSPNTGTTTYTYDSAGNRLTRTD
ncbi:hypothetical protein EVC37_24690, partial [Methylocaldum sp. BRCS4]|nr:hypothetical protein [Methylocaldum sp. BRCS4]